LANESANGHLHYGRALALFLAAYIAITVLASGVSMVLDASMHPQVQDDLHSTSHILSERLYPLLNFFVRTGFGRIYFGDRTPPPSARRAEALRVGLLWLGLALIVDFAGFVVIEQPFSAGVLDLDVAHFPWIYLIYLFVFSGPLCAAALKARSLRALGQPAAMQDAAAAMQDGAAVQDGAASEDGAASSGR